MHGRVLSICGVLAVVFLLGSALLAQPAADSALDAALERAMKSAMLKVAPCVVQIQTAGGIDTISTGPQIGSVLRVGEGPTSGVIVSPDGYIITSAYNFTNKPSEIFVSVSGKKDRYVAKVIANDNARMLTLIKIDAEKLPVPSVTPRKDIKVGQWAIALGRTWSNLESPPSISVGIISAIDRIWGKAIQTDAKVSPVNYGGPLIDIEGRVQGILVPASPRDDDETAGREWYDSGIGFAIPLEDVNAVLPRLKEGRDLNRGFLGVTPKGKDIYGAAPVVEQITPNSTAAKAGIKPGDTIIEINGVAIHRQAQVQHMLGTKYEGDVVSVKIKRGSDEIALPNLRLTGRLATPSRSFLGILPMRDDPELGLEVRYVYPKSPAETAGIKEGDRVVGIGTTKEKPKAFAGRAGLAGALANFMPGSEVRIDVRRRGAKKAETLTVKLGEIPDQVPDKLPEIASLKRALEPAKTVGVAPKPMADAPKKERGDPTKVETGMLKRNNAGRDHEYWISVPENYDPNIAYALVVWLHPVGQGKEKNAEAMADAWESFCADRHIILAGPKAVNETGWLASEADFIREVVRDVAAQYTIDGERVIAHGMGVGGQLAYYLGLNDRDTFRGVATTGATLTSPLKRNAANARVSFFIVAGGKDPRARSIQDTRSQLMGQKYPVIFREIPEMGHQYLDEDTLREMVRWIDSLDRI